MSGKSIVKKILDHPDRDEVIAKLIIGVDPKDINEWLDAKYAPTNEKKFIFSEKDLKNFADNYLDIYSTIQEDLQKVRSGEDNITLSIQSMPAYKEILVKTAGQELDIRASLKTLANAIETRMGQVFDVIQEDPNNINTRVDNTLIKYAEVFGNLLEKYYKFTEAPEANLTQNITVNVVDKQITVIHEAIREILSDMNIESSMKFIDLVSQKMDKLKLVEKDGIQSPSARLAEAKIIHEEITKSMEEE